MKIHQLKTWPEYFNSIVDGSKKSELRINDRDFSVGDYVVFYEFVPDTQVFTGKCCGGKITHVFKDTNEFSFLGDYCIFSFIKLEQHSIF